MRLFCFVWFQAFYTAQAKLPISRKEILALYFNPEQMAHFIKAPQIQLKY